MKKLFLPLVFISAGAFAQTKTDVETITRKVADRVIENTSFQFINNATGEKFASTKGRDTSMYVKAESKYNKWAYVNGVLNTGMVRLGSILNDNKYADYSQHNFDFIFSNIEYFKKLRDGKSPKPEWGAFYSMSNLDACGAMAAGLADVYATDAKKDFRSYLDRAGDYILHKQKRLEDGTLARPNPHNATIWADDLYMSVPFLARMGKITGDNKYFDDAIKQVENFNKHLYDPATGLFFHCWYSDVQMNGVGHWGRSNGWLAVAQTELLNNLPANHPKRQQLINLLLRQIVGYSRYQDTTGLWHQVLDKPDSYLESSVTAMFTYAVAKAVNEGWINKSYLTIAKDGWQGLTTKITADGQIQDVCIGTNIAENIRFYYDRPKQLNDTHALGALLLAGAELIRAEKINK